MFEIIFLKILLQLFIFLLQTVPKCNTSIQYTVKNLVKLIFKPPTPKNSLFLIRPNPKKFQICNGDIYEIWLTLLCETMTYFTITYIFFFVFQVIICGQNFSNFYLIRQVHPNPNIRRHLCYYSVQCQQFLATSKPNILIS